MHNMRKCMCYALFIIKTTNAIYGLCCVMQSYVVLTDFKRAYGTVLNSFVIINS